MFQGCFLFNMNGFLQWQGFPFGSPSTTNQKGSASHFEHLPFETRVFFRRTPRRWRRACAAAPALRSRTRGVLRNAHGWPARCKSWPTLNFAWMVGLQLFANEWVYLQTTKQNQLLAEQISQPGEGCPFQGSLSCEPFANSVVHPWLARGFSPRFPVSPAGKPTPSGVQS